MLQGIILYGVVLLCCVFSYKKSPEKTLLAIKKSQKSLFTILPQFIAILLFVGIMLALVDRTVIQSLLGYDSGWKGVGIASVIGSITLIPGFLAFPMAAMLLKSGAGYMQIAAFISTLMMVGVITLPLEIKYFGKKFSFLRNSLAFAFSFIVALIIGWVMGALV
jgi:uncharacterized membrane protein YraQ (UPF0718 family)